MFFNKIIILHVDLSLTASSSGTTIEKSREDLGCVGSFLHWVSNYAVQYTILHTTVPSLYNLSGILTGQIPRISLSAHSIMRALASLSKEPPDYITSTQKAAPLILSCSFVDAHVDFPCSPSLLCRAVFSVTYLGW